MISKRFAFALALPALLLAAAPAFAQAQEEVPDEVVENLAAVARANLGGALTGDGKPLAPETEEERAKPLVSRALETQIVTRGMVSAGFQRCQLNWAKESFLPFMRALRASARYNERQIAYVAVLHGMAQKMILQDLPEARGDCTPESIAELRTEAARLPSDAP